MSDDGAPKSSYELAMERLRAKDKAEGVEEKTLTPEQRAEIAEVRRVCDAKVAEREILHRSAMRAMADPAGRETLEEEYRRDRERYASERDGKIEKIRGRESGR